jgi:hypothetical protein
VTLDHLLSYDSIQQVDFEPPAEGITGAAVAAVCGGVWFFGGHPPLVKRLLWKLDDEYQRGN